MSGSSYLLPLIHLKTSTPWVVNTFSPQNSRQYVKAVSCCYKQNKILTRYLNYNDACFILILFTWPLTRFSMLGLDEVAMLPGNPLVTSLHMPARFTSPLSMSLLHIPLAIRSTVQVNSSTLQVKGTFLNSWN